LTVRAGRGAPPADATDQEKSRRKDYMACESHRPPETQPAVVDDVLSHLRR
jgi:hypothetical protein